MIDHSVFKHLINQYISAIIVSNSCLKSKNLKFDDINGKTHIYELPDYFLNIPYEWSRNAIGNFVLIRE